MPKPGSFPHMEFGTNQLISKFKEMKFFMQIDVLVLSNL